MNFRFLNKEDVTAYRELRLISLQESTLAFSDSYEDELNKSDSYYRSELEIIGLPAESFVLGMFSNTNELIGFLKFRKDQRAKAKHKASLHTLYIKPQYRGNGLGKIFITELYKTIEPLQGLEQIHVWVLISDSSAVDFYKKCGFQNQGAIVKNDLKIGSTYLDAQYMVKDLI